GWNSTLIRRNDVEGVRHGWLPVDLVADVDLVIALVRADAPETEEPGPGTELLAHELALEHEMTLRDPEVTPELLADAVDVHLKRGPHAARELYAPIRHQRARSE